MNRGAQQQNQRSAMHHFLLCVTERGRARGGKRGGGGGNGCAVGRGRVSAFYGGEISKRPSDVESISRMPPWYRSSLDQLACATCRWPAILNAGLWRAAPRRRRPPPSRPLPHDLLRSPPQLRADARWPPGHVVSLPGRGHPPGPPRKGTRVVPAVTHSSAIAPLIRPA
ncbi:hypothetical protein GW17_00009444 [Ensete ventricosum]|nr:hypothetical protein GW17_00009444 [Ensete ventricosum]RZR93965.1 hypothetical protein BHM03_00022551 [Ensete ventricosum]